MKPYSLACGLFLVAASFVAALTLSDHKSLNRHLKSSVTQSIDSSQELVSDPRSSDQKPTAFSRQLASAKLPQGTPVITLICRDSSKAMLELERSGSEYILSGQLEEPLLSPVPLSFSFAFTSTSLDEDSDIDPVLSFLEGKGSLYSDTNGLKKHVKQLSIADLSSKGSARLILETDQEQIEMTDCLVNTTALFQLAPLERRPSLALAR